MCSDGVWDELGNDEVAKLIGETRKDINANLAQPILAKLKNHNRDNATAIVVKLK